MRSFFHENVFETAVGFGVAAATVGEKIVDIRAGKIESAVVEKELRTAPGGEGMGIDAGRGGGPGRGLVFIGYSTGERDYHKK
jgi:hypothetical protein